MTKYEQRSNESGRSRWLGVAVLVLPTFVIGIDMTVLHLAVPELSEELGPSSSELLWIVDIYGFLIAGLLITMGTLGDRIGRRKLLMIGGGAFAAMSVVAAFSTSAEMLIVARALLGIAGATLMPSTLALIRTLFPDEKERTTAISVWAVAIFAGMGLGPALGGVMLELFPWGSVFLFAVPLMLALVVAAPVFLPEAKDDTGERERLDLSSVALSLAAIIGVMWGLKRVAEHGLDVAAVVSTSAALIVGVAFVRRQLRLPDPLLDLRLFRSRALSAALSTQTLTLVALGGTQFFVGQYLQLVLGYSPLEAGLWTVPPTLVGIVGAFLAPWLAQRVRPAYVIASGLLIATGGFGLLVPLSSDSGLAVVLISYGVLSFGVGPMFTISTDLITGAAPKERAGSAAALSETGNELGFALGIGLLGAAGAALYRGQIEIPAGATPEQAESAQDTLGGAMEVAGELPAASAAPLLDSARESFSEGMALAAGLGAGITVTAAMIVALVLRKLGSPVPDAPPEAEREPARA